MAAWSPSRTHSLPCDPPCCPLFQVLLDCMRAVAQEQGGKTLAQVWRQGHYMRPSCLVRPVLTAPSMPAWRPPAHACSLPGVGHLWCVPPNSQVAINWTMCKGALPIPGAKRAEQVRVQAAHRMPWLLLLGFDMADTPVLPPGAAPHALAPWASPSA